MVCPQSYQPPFGAALGQAIGRKGHKAQSSVESTLLPHSFTWLNAKSLLGVSKPKLKSLMFAFMSVGAFWGGRNFIF